ncbi:WD repeat-containing protein 38 isoform X1 [Camelus bactrianus]|uniref:WD repeat-containing protein 38 isoform X1 n=1 Tax=Camelus bactrianus TaxID=9837 RepID=A0AC58Q7Q9_CAMBA
MAGGRGPMNSEAPGTLAVGRVKFFDRHRGEVNSSAFSPDGQRLLTASEDGCVYGWETQSGRLLWRLGGHTGPVKFCRFSPDGRLFASTSCDCTIRLWDVAETKCLQVLKGHQRSVETVSFSHDSKQLASGGWDKTVMLWEVQATGSWDSTIRMWDLRARTPAFFHQELEGHSGNISCLCYSASGLLASGSWDKTIHIWKPSTRSLLVQLKGHITWVKSIAFSPDGLQLASAGYSHTVKVWDCNSGKCIETLKVRPVETRVQWKACTPRAQYCTSGRESWMWPTHVPLPQMGNSWCLELLISQDAKPAANHPELVEHNITIYGSQTFHPCLSLSRGHRVW